MLEPSILLPAAINGLTMGAVYALIALGLTLIYGVLHIINFAHGSLLMVALYGVFFLYKLLGVDPYAAMLVLVPAGFVAGYALQRSVIGAIKPGRDQNVLLITLGVSIVLDNLAVYFFTGDTQTIDTRYSLEMVNLGVALVSLPRLIGLVAALVFTAALWLLIGSTDLGRAIRAVAKEPHGARLVGIDVDHIFAMSFGIGTACLGAAACLLLPMFYVSPHVGQVFVLIAFTVVVLGGMGSFTGALIGGLLIGVTESLGGLIFGESAGQLAIFLIFIAVLLFRPTGLFGNRLS
ncbi:MAG TPA: branched-chain amino acid ABC transporter permease [Alphaproteobacteria bacterium]|nr:branched-chain amino acid ABC transporter permease [Alphaproteobacteria bacterium]